MLFRIWDLSDQKYANLRGVLLIVYNDFVLKKKIKICINDSTELIRRNLWNKENGVFLQFSMNIIASKPALRSVT